MTRHKLPAAVHLFFLRGDQILLLRRFNTGYADGMYSVPAGHLDGGEPVRRAAAREAWEEVGVTVDPADVRFVGVFHRCEHDERVDFFVTVLRWVGEPANSEPDRCDELRWANRNYLPANTIPYVRQAIYNLALGVTIQEYGWEGDVKRGKADFC